MPTGTSEVVEIEQQIIATQEALTSKIGELEVRTVGSVRDTINSVTGTLGAVSDTVERIREMANPEAVSEIIQNTVGAIPLKETVRNQPWASVGGAVLAGFFTGVIAFGRSRTAAPVATGLAGSPPPPSPLSGLFDSLAERFGSELRKTTDSVLHAVGEKVSGHLAGLISNPAERPNPTVGANGTAV